MTDNTGSIRFDRRKYPRIGRTFIVSYREISSAGLKFDVSQTKNISEGGLLFTTNRKFPKGVILELKIRLPQFSDFVTLNVQVVDSGDVGGGLIADTRVKFISVKEDVKKAIKEIIDYGSKQ